MPPDAREALGRSLTRPGPIAYTQPSEVLRSLSESRKLLEEARQEMQEQSEKKQIPVSHTFSPLPGFFERQAELKTLQNALAGVPQVSASILAVGVKR